jgi:predicted dehydrogenase
MTKIRCAVIGVGYLGKFHAEKYFNLENAELVAVCDSNIHRAEEVAQLYQTQAIDDYHTLKDKVDAVSIAVPTLHHYEVAKFFLTNNIHVLVEKPITVSVEQADELIALSKKNKLILQVGHLERFNTVLREVEHSLDFPRYIESHRLSMFNPRGTDVSVMLDLMIHDIDIIQYLINSPITEIRANGAAVLTNDIDIATARIQFENACVANVTASRVSLKSERKMRIFQHDAYIFLDLQNPMVSIHRKGEGEMFPGIPEIIKHEQTFEKGDALKDEIIAFLNSITHQTPAVVTGEDGRRALATAIEIGRLVQSQFDIAPADSI